MPLVEFLAARPDSISGSRSGPQPPCTLAVSRAEMAMNETPQLPRGIFSEGADSCLHGLPRENCPYPPGSAERGAWLEGWNQTAHRDSTVHEGSDNNGTQRPEAPR